MGIPKQMPSISASKQMGAIERGVQSLRHRENYNMAERLKAPLPYPGGKADMAAAIWARLGDTPNYVEPFMGSAAVLLARPHDLNGKTETANDIDGFLTCAYRAIQYAPDEVAYYCDHPVNEIDLTAYHLWLKSLRTDLTERLFADPFYYDAQVAGAFLWGIASWIGDGWCVADGPWINVDGRLVDRRTLPEDDQVEGVWKATPQVSARLQHGQGTMYQGVQAHRYRASVPRQMPDVGGRDERKGPIKGVQAYRHHAGVPRQMPNVSGSNRAGTCDGSTVNCGIFRERETDTALAAYFARLSDRLRRVRFLCGDWRRACKDSVTVNHGLTGCFIDSPYPQSEHSMGYHSEDGKDVWFESARWAAEHGDDKRLRIAVCGYMSPACDAMFPPTWERLPWEARGGYANQSKNGRGRSNAKREMIWFSPNCIDSKTDYGPLFAGLEPA